MLKSKIHRAVLTGALLDYEGSIAIDADLLQAADMIPGEQVHVLNMATGARLVTYIIEAPGGSGTIMLNGPAARMGMKGDEVVIIAYCGMDEHESICFKPRVILVDSNNHIKQLPESAAGPTS